MYTKMRLKLNIRGNEIGVDGEVIKRSPYFRALLERNDIGEIDNDLNEFLHYIEFLKGNTDNPGPLGEYYMSGKCKPIISQEKNLIEWAEKPVTINKRNTPFEAVYQYCEYQNCESTPLVVSQHSCLSTEDTSWTTSSWHNTECSDVCTMKTHINTFFFSVENFKVVSNRKVKHIKIVYKNINTSVEHVIFDEDNHCFMTRNMKVPPMFFDIVEGKDLYLTIEVCEGSFDPWVQFLYDGNNINPNRYYKRLREGLFHIDIVNGTIYSNIDSMLNADKLLHMRYTRQHVKSKDKNAMKQKYHHYFEPIVPKRIKTFHVNLRYLGSISEITRDHMREIYESLSDDHHRVLTELDSIDKEFYIPKSVGELSVAMTQPTYNIPYFDFNELYDSKYELPEKMIDGFYLLTIKAVHIIRIDFEKYIFDKTVDVWERVPVFNEYYL